MKFLAPEQRHDKGNAVNWKDAEEILITGKLRKDDPGDVLTLGLSSSDHPELKTEKDWDRLEKRLLADNEFKIRYAKPRALFGIVGLFITFLGMVLVSPGMPLRALAFILGPLFALLGFISMALVGLFGLPLIIYWLLNREHDDPFKGGKIE